MENRELTMDDYLAMLRRRIKVILIPTLVAPLAGFLVSYLFAAKYTSNSLVLVVGQKVPEGIVQSVVTEDLAQRIATLQQQVLSQERLQPMVERLGLAKSGQDADDAIEAIRNNMTVEPVITDLSQIASGSSKKKPGQSSPVPGFTVGYTASSARRAQLICNELTSLLLTENLRSREDVARGTTDFLSKQVEDTKRNLDELDSKLADFKKQYMGQLPGDEDSNLKILMGLNSQLEANTQTLSRAQQDKAYTESLLAQQLTAWKNSMSSNNPQTLQQQLSQLQSQLIDLQARYTDDHPDVIKTKADIAEVKKRLAEANAPSKSTDTVADKGPGSEPPELRQLRLQVHQYEDLIVQGTRDQKRLTEEIALYQGRVSLSPAIEEQYKQMARNYENTQKVYQDLLADKSKSDIALQMERQQEGEQMRMLNPANLPDTPSFPNRLLFAGAGLGAGLALGCTLALWLEFRDNSIRTQADAEAALELPMLVAVPWVAEPVLENGNGRFWNRKKQPHEREQGKEAARF
jgi:uncharacterized protein involved in exopolysaccharide biosynthesis